MKRHAGNVQPWGHLPYTACFTSARADSAGHALHSLHRPQPAELTSILQRHNIIVRRAPHGRRLTSVQHRSLLLGRQRNQLSAGDTVAIKSVDASSFRSIAQIDQVQDEISVLSGLKHPNIIRLLVGASEVYLLPAREMQLVADARKSSCQCFRTPASFACCGVSIDFSAACGGLHV